MDQTTDGAYSDILLGILQPRFLEISIINSTLLNLMLRVHSFKHTFGRQQIYPLGTSDKIFLLAPQIPATAPGP
jgi:hypothetical protein